MERALHLAGEHDAEIGEGLADALQERAFGEMPPPRPEEVEGRFELLGIEAVEKEGARRYRTFDRADFHRHGASRLELRHQTERA